MLSFGERRGLVERLLSCPSLSSPDSMQAVIGNLLPPVANGVARAAQANLDISNLVTTCLNYPHSLQALMEELGFFEQGSIPFREVQRYVGEIAVI